MSRVLAVCYSPNHPNILLSGGWDDTVQVCCCPPNHLCVLVGENDLPCGLGMSGEWDLSSVVHVVMRKVDIMNCSCYRAVKLLEYGMV